MAYKIDFHTHSEASPDGALQLKHYERMLTHQRLHCIAVTDHNTIEFASWLQAELGSDRIIVGEEINTTEGEIIGLYLTEAVPAGLSLKRAIRRVKKQGGLVYVPHPFETVRKGIAEEVLDSIAGEVDIIETQNGRAVFQNTSKQAMSWAASHNIPGAAASDAHGVVGWGRTYTLLDEMPQRETLLALLKGASYERAFPTMRGVLYPKLNRFRKKGRHA